MKSVVLNGAGASAAETNLVALVEDGRVVAECVLSGRGASEQFASTLRMLLDRVQWKEAPDQVIAVLGPGSFTGLRASLSLASGLAAGWKCPTLGVTLGEAIRATLNREDVVCISVARRGRYFVDPPVGKIFAVQEADLLGSRFEYVAGDAVLSENIDWGDAVIDCVTPTAQGIVRAARHKTSQMLLPLYVDPPEAKPPAAGLRPFPK